MARIRSTRKTRNHKNSVRIHKSMKGGKQSNIKILIKKILGITNETPDSYDPKKDPNYGVSGYYNKLLFIYNNVWSTLDRAIVEQLTQELTSERGRYAMFIHPGRSRVYHELIKDLDHLKVMEKDLGREVKLEDFVGNRFPNGKTCLDYGFAKCYSCHGIDFDTWQKAQEGKQLGDMEIPTYLNVNPIEISDYNTAKAEAAAAAAAAQAGNHSSDELNRPPPDTDYPIAPIALSAGKSRCRRHSRHRTIKKSRKVRKSRKSRR